MRIGNILPCGIMCDLCATFSSSRGAFELGDSCVDDRHGNREGIGAEASPIVALTYFAAQCAACGDLLRQYIK